MRSYVTVIEVMVRELTMGVVSIDLAIIVEVTMRGHCREGHLREILRPHSSLQQRGSWVRN